MRVNAKTSGPRGLIGFDLFGPNPLRLPGFSEASWVRAIEGVKREINMKTHATSLRFLSEVGTDIGTFRPVASTSRSPDPAAELVIKWGAAASREGQRF